MDESEEQEQEQEQEDERGGALAIHWLPASQRPATVIHQSITLLIHRWGEGDGRGGGRGGGRAGAVLWRFIGGAGWKRRQPNTAKMAAPQDGSTPRWQHPKMAAPQDGRTPVGGSRQDGCALGTRGEWMWLVDSRASSGVSRPAGCLKAVCLTATTAARLPAPDVSIDPESGVVRRHHVHSGCYAKALQRAVQEAGIEKRVTSHGIRHAFDSVASSGSFTLPLCSRAARSSQSVSRLPPPLGSHVAKGVGGTGVKSPLYVLSSQQAVGGPSW